MTRFLHLHFCRIEKPSLGVASHPVELALVHHGHVRRVLLVLEDVLHFARNPANKK